MGPRPLPKLELRDGVPTHLRTMVVIPTLLTSQAEIQELIDRLEVHYLANSDGEKDALFSRRECIRSRSVRR